MAGVLKQTTGITGLAVRKDAHYKLATLYSQILKVLNTLPQNSEYRRHTEKLVKDRMAVLNSTTDIATIEEKIACGQAEELIIQARNELKLSKKMQLWKPWEKLIAEAPANQWTWPPHK